jgi:nitrite reductase/ring-hydroxylating ferredoxin subunit
MKKIAFVFLLSLVFPACDGGRFNNNNPFVPNFSFSVDINVNLPTFSSLQFPSNAIYIPQGVAGARGIIVFNSGSGYYAYDAACPNQPISSCSTMVINGIYAVCPCDEEQYSLFTGLGSLQYPMKRYRVEVNLPIIRVFN